MFSQNVLHPFTSNIEEEEEVIISSFNDDFELNNNNSLIQNFNNNNINWLNGLEYDTKQYYIQTIFSLYILWICALIFGRIIEYLYIPSLLGNFFFANIFLNVKIIIYF